MTKIEGSGSAPDPDPLVRGMDPWIRSGSTPKCHGSATLIIGLPDGDAGVASLGRLQALLIRRCVVVSKGYRGSLKQNICLKKVWWGGGRDLKYKQVIVLRVRLDPGWVKNPDQDPGSGPRMNNPDHI
jgi:hypothetical protein